MLKECWWGVLILALCVSNAHLTVAAGTENATALSNKLVPKVVKTLELCPAWSDTSAETNQIMAMLTPLSELETQVLRAGITDFVAKCVAENKYNIANMSKLFVLNRILFAVPPKEKFQGPFFGGWEGVPHDDHQVDMMWPLGLGKNGHLELTGKYSGYSGPRYLAVGEFEHFLRKYGRRRAQ